MGEKRPFIVTLIGDVSILCAIIWIIISFLSLIKTFSFFEMAASGLFISGLQLLLSIAFLAAAIGYLRLKKWGYWLLLTSNICFLATSIISFLQSKQQSSYIGILWVVISLLFIMPTRTYFYEEAPSE